LSFGTEHLSLYQLTIEPGTRFQTEALAGRLVLPDEDRGADLFELTRALTASAGMPAYEISNHARTGAESRHNLTYWRYQDYAGIGPGAHGRRTGVATQRRRKPENWIDAVARNGHGIEQEDALTPRERAVEAMLMGLRLAEGIDLDRISTLGERAIDDLADRHAIDRLSAQGLLKHEGARLCATDAGIPVLNAILAEVVRLPDNLTV
jgi:oxygen-independent coproporphyrinogen-3 oxidase